MGLISDTGFSYGHGVVTVTAGAGVGYVVALGAGFHAAGGSRHLQRRGGRETIAYGLYQDAACTTPWGDSDSFGTFPAGGEHGVGTGRAEALTIYARLLVTTLGTPGLYEDSVTVTVLY